MGTRVVKNYPSPRLMETIGATNQTPPEAIGELVANCFDARCGNEKLTITIDMCGGQVAVIDDGKGMTAEILEKAVCIAEDNFKIDAWMFDSSQKQYVSATGKLRYMGTSKAKIHKVTRHRVENKIKVGIEDK